MGEGSAGPGVVSPVLFGIEFGIGIGFEIQSQSLVLLSLVVRFGLKTLWGLVWVFGFVDVYRSSRQIRSSGHS